MLGNFLDGIKLCVFIESVLYNFLCNLFVVIFNLKVFICIEFYLWLLFEGYEGKFLYKVKKCYVLSFI